MTSLSIIIPTYNRLSQLKQVLAGLEQQQYPFEKFDVIVVSDGSTDGTHEYLASIQTPLRIHPVIQANGGPAAARNAGIQHATGDIVLFIDDDIVPTPQLVQEHMRFHITEPNLVTLGPMMSPTDYRLSPWVAWEQAMLYKQYDAMTAGKWEPTARQFYTGNTALARKHLLNIGGFDERFRRAEDIELAYRLYNHDLRFVFNPQAVGYHYAQRSFRAWLETPYAYGRNDIVFTREQHPWILQNLREEFTTRNLLTRMLVQGCLDRSTITKMALFILKRLADTSFALHVNHISIAGYSAIFNLRYYQGAADELGGRAGFLNKLSS